MKKILYIAAAISALSFGTAHAADQNLYVGASGGSTKYNALPNIDDSTGYKLTVGYMTNANFGMELSYIDFGDTDFRVNGVKGTIKLTGANVSLVGRLPLGQDFSVHAKVGYFGGDAKATGPAGSAKASGSDPSYGVGMEYAFNKNVGMRVEYDRVSNSDSTEMVSLGVVVKF